MKLFYTRREIEELERKRDKELWELRRNEDIDRRLCELERKVGMILERDYNIGILKQEKDWSDSHITCQSSCGGGGC